MRALSVAALLACARVALCASPDDGFYLPDNHTMDCHATCHMHGLECNADASASGPLSELLTESDFNAALAGAAARSGSILNVVDACVAFFQEPDADADASLPLFGYSGDCYRPVLGASGSFPMTCSATPSINVKLRLCPCLRSTEPAPPPNPPALPQVACGRTEALLSSGHTYDECLEIKRVSYPLATFFVAPAPVPPGDRGLCNLQVIPACFLLARTILAPSLDLLDLLTLLTLLASAWC